MSLTQCWSARHYFCFRGLAFERTSFHQHKVQFIHLTMSPCHHNSHRTLVLCVHFNLPSSLHARSMSTHEPGTRTLRWQHGRPWTYRWHPPPVALPRVGVRKNTERSNDPPTQSLGRPQAGRGARCLLCTWLLWLVSDLLFCKPPPCQVPRVAGSVRFEHACVLWP